MGYKIGDTVRHVEYKNLSGVIQYRRLRSRSNEIMCYYPTFMEDFLNIPKVKSYYEEKFPDGRGTFFRDEHIRPCKIVLTEKKVSSINKFLIPFSFNPEDNWENGLKLNVVLG